MKHYYIRYCLNKTGEGPGGNFNEPSVQKILRNLQDLQENLPAKSSPLVNFLRCTSKLHKMCVAENLPEDYQKLEYKENL